MFDRIFGRRNDQERVRGEGRLPPGQSLTNRFPVLHYGPVPRFNPEMGPNFLLATHFDGRPLDPDHGYPLRGVVGSIPGTDYKTPYLWKGGKWLRSLEFLANDRLGFWEQAGYHNEADVWKEQRFAR